jgi:hypothetical protein
MAVVDLCYCLFLFNRESFYEALISYIDKIDQIPSRALSRACRVTALRKQVLKSDSRYPFYFTTPFPHNGISDRLKI